MSEQVLTITPLLFPNRHSYRFLRKYPFIHFGCAISFYIERPLMQRRLLRFVSRQTSAIFPLPLLSLISLAEKFVNSPFGEFYLDWYIVHFFQILPMPTPAPNGLFGHNPFCSVFIYCQPCHNITFLVCSLVVILFFLSYHSLTVFQNFIHRKPLRFFSLLEAIMQFYHKLNLQFFVASP